MIDVAQHQVGTDGAVTLVLRIVGPFPDDPEAVAADALGVVTIDGDDVLVAWTWSAPMVPPDPVAVCTRHLLDVVNRWALAWSPTGLDLTEGPA